MNKILKICIGPDSNIFLHTFSCPEFLFVLKPKMFQKSRAFANVTYDVIVNCGCDDVGEVSTKCQNRFFFRLQNEWKIETYLRFSVLKPVLAFYSEVYWRKKYVKKQEIALELISGFNNVGKNLFGRHLIQYITFAPNL